MWFVFPQLAGLGRSPMARHYAIANIAEARAYLRHSTLGPRLRAITTAAIGVPDVTAEAIFGDIDAMKLRSSLTLFLEAADDDGDRALFTRALERFFSGSADPETKRLLAD